ncbi:MAG: META domain-containing protein [Rikenellaceae bacterium]|nr:META domain-containing protein [Rikenellaceae bacterium]
MKKTLLNAFVVAAICGPALFSSCKVRNTNYQALIDKTWKLTEVVHKDSSRAIVIPAGVEIIFSDSSRVYGNAGCNHINGMYETAGHDQIGLDRVAATLMWCQNMEFETAYLQWLEKVVSYEATADRLELQGTGGRFTLIYDNGGAAN